MHKANYTGYRPTWAEINLKHIAYNINSIRKIIPKDTRILATVKADAYGHGIIPVSKTLVSGGIDYLGVASLDEAVVLRNSGIKSSILVLGGILPRDAEAVIRYGLTQAVYTGSVARALNAAARRANSKARVHIKVDTGMGRLGVWHRDALSFINKINKLTFIDMEGVFTHLSSADSDAGFTNEQIAIFDIILRKLEGAGINIPLRHVANSAGLVYFKRSHYNLVRPGIIIYGLTPSSRIRFKAKPALSLKTKIIYIKNVPKGRSISYGRSFIIKKNTVIATLPVGYGDGYPRALSNKAKVLVRGREASIVGRVCMDQVMIDVGHIKNAKIADTVTLIGKDKKNIIRAEDLAALSDTICYEIVCGIGNRIPRIYK